METTVVIIRAEMAPPVLTDLLPSRVSVLLEDRVTDVRVSLYYLL